MKFRVVLGFAVMCGSMPPAAASAFRIGSTIRIAIHPNGGHEIAHPRRWWWGMRTDRVRDTRSLRFKLGGTRLVLESKGNTAQVHRPGAVHPLVSQDLFVGFTPANRMMRMERTLHVKADAAYDVDAVTRGAGLGFDARLEQIRAVLPSATPLLEDGPMRITDELADAVDETGIRLEIHPLIRQLVLSIDSAAIVVQQEEYAMTMFRSRIRLEPGEFVDLTNVWGQEQLRLEYEADPPAPQ